MKRQTEGRCHPLFLLLIHVTLLSFIPHQHHILFMYFLLAFIHIVCFCVQFYCFYVFKF